MNDSVETTASRDGVIPYLMVDDGAAAIDYYSAVFGAVETLRLEAPDGRIVHAALSFDDGALFLGDDFPEMNEGKGSTPTAIGGTAVTCHRYVADCDAIVAKAVDAGAELLFEPTDMFWGDRFAKIRDPFGHEWSIATHLRDVTPEEMAAAAAEMFAEHE